MDHHVWYQTLLLVSHKRLTIKEHIFEFDSMGKKVKNWFKVNRFDSRYQILTEECASGNPITRSSVIFVIIYWDHQVEVYGKADSG